jgi:zinc protease
VAAYEKHLAQRPRSTRTLTKPPRYRAPKASRTRVFDLPKEQSHIVLGYPGLTLDDPRRHALEVLTELLGGHGGHLFDAVREKRGLAYSVTALSIEGVDPGYFAAYAATSPGKEVAVIEAIDDVLQHVANKGPTTREMQRIKRHLIGSRAIGLQRCSARAAATALDELYGLGYDNFEKYADEIDGIHGNDVQSIARELLTDDARQIACVGPNVSERGLDKL